ncbi:MAG: RNA pyrophosphohydrolase [Alphaproteobacteria bacterium]|nr:RNA pyrophosphohydrolase [Alphaproteobacteria bacterium]
MITITSHIYVCLKFYVSITILIYEQIPMDGIYRPCVGAVILNDVQKIFLGQRAGIDGAWQMPQGGIDAHESEEQALLRELEEEIGTNQVEILAQSAHWHTYILPEPLRIKMKSYWGAGVIGQRQKWFLCRFKGLEASINLGDVSPEFSSYMWADPQTVLDTCVEFKKKIYHDVLMEFGLIQGS